MLCFVDKYGRFTLKEARWFDDDEETEADFYDSTSFENTPSPQSVPSVERSASGSSSNDPSAWSPGSVEDVAPMRFHTNTVLANEVPRLAPSEPKPGLGSINGVEPLKASAPTQSDSISETPGGSSGPPPQGGRFFSNPTNLRTLMTGSGDGYRSPEPPSCLDTLSPLYSRSLHRQGPAPGGGSTSSRLNPQGTSVKQSGPSFSAQQPVMTRSPNGPGFNAGYGYGLPPASPSSSVLPAELMVYNDLMMDIGTAQYLGSEMQDLRSPPFAHPSMLTNSNEGANGFGSSADGYQWPGASQHVMMHGAPQPTLSFDFSQSGQSHHGVAQTSAQRGGTNSGEQWPAGGVTDYE